MKVLAYVHLRNINNSTGAGRVARNIVEALLLRGEDEIRILADRSDHGAISRDVGPPWADLKYHLFRLDTSAQQRMWYLFNAPKAEDYWPEVEVVYCAGESYVPKRRARLAVLVHDAAFFDDGALERNFRFRLQQFRWNMLYRKLDRHADMFHTVSKFSAERLGHYFPSIRSRLTVIPNAVTEVFFSNDRSNDSEHLAKWGLRGRSYVLLPRGLWYRKNADLVLDAWPRLREMHKDLLLVVTSHNDPVFVERATRLDKSIVLTGFIEDTELRALYRGAVAVWFPSRYEGFGMPVIESMACGTPVVASDAASLPEVAGDAALFASVDKADEHVSALEYLIQNEGARRDYSDRGLARASGYTWKESARQLRTALANLL